MNEKEILKIIISVALIIAGCLCIGTSLDKKIWTPFCLGIGCIIAVFYMNEEI